MKSQTLIAILTLTVSLLFSGTGLFADPAEALDISSSEIFTVNTEEEIPQTVLEYFYRELPLDIPVVLDIDAGRFSYALEKLYKEKLLKEGYRLFEQEQENSFILKITFAEASRTRSTGFLIFQKHNQEDFFYFSSQVTKMPESQILNFENLTLTRISKPKSSNMKWYDPLLISAFIGTLAYLFYFGGN